MDEKKEKQKKIAQASLNLLKRVYEISPQVSSDGAVEYYVVGSIATNLLPLVKRMDTLIIDKSTHEQVMEGRTIEMTPKNQEAFCSAVRPSRSNDIDYVIVRNGPYSAEKAILGNTPHCNAIKKGLENDFALVFPTSHRQGGSMMEEHDDTKSGKHYIARAELEDGTIIYMPTIEAILDYKYKEAESTKDDEVPVKTRDLKRIYDAACTVTEPGLVEYLDKMRERFEVLFMYVSKNNENALGEE